MQKALWVINLAVRCGFIIVGLLMLLGKLMPAYVPSQFRWMMGTVFILYGMLRLVMMFVPNRPPQ